MDQKSFKNAHEEALARLCFVCGEFIKKSLKCYVVESNLEFIRAGLNSPGISSIPDVTPYHFCQNCYRSLCHVTGGTTVKTTRSQILEWNPCGPDCKTCAFFSKKKTGGRPPKKKTKTVGCPKAGVWSMKSIPTAKEIHYDLGSSVLSCNTADSLERCLCMYCEKVTAGPILFKCEHMSCRSCFIRHNFKKPISETKCIKCGYLIISSTDVAASGIIQTCIDNLKATCNTGSCEESIPLSDLQAHKSECSGQPKSIKSLISQEMKILISHSKNGIIELPTGGQPMCFKQISKPRKEKENVSPETLRRRRSCVTDVICTQFGKDGQDHYIAEVIRRKGKDDRAALLVEMGLGGEITVEEEIAMMVDMTAPWNMLRKLRKWLEMFGLKCPSEKRMREQIAIWNVGDDIACEKAPFLMPKDKKTGKEVMKSRAMAYVIDLQSHIWRSLDLLYENNLMHEYDAMNNEIHIKIGGDHGDKSFKMSFQNCNRKNPNSKQSTTVFCAFEAKDKKTNCKTALMQYQDCISNMQKSTWRERKVRVFMFGDYEFLCNMYGISGANGKHPCLWCTVTSDMMQLCPENRNHAAKERTLANMETDLQKFRQKHKGNIKQAMHANNVIDEPFFDIPLDQVCIPGLHLTLGIFLKIFKIFDKACRRLDYRLVRHDDDDSVMDELFFKEGKIYNFRESLAVCTETFHHQLSQLEDEDTDTRMILENTFKEHSEKVENMITTLESDLEEFKKKNNLEESDGPIETKLEELLQSKNVKRQAYHSNSFIGNHCHKLLQDGHYQEICGLPLKIVSEMEPDNTRLQAIALDVKEKFTSLFGLYSVCHMAFNSSDIVDVSLLETAIKDFMCYWRSNMPGESISPKMHMLEDHMVPFLKKWKLGCGFYGEQGGESIHREFKRLGSSHSGLNDPVKRLLAVMKRHHLNVYPESLKGENKPIVRRRGQYKRKLDQVG